jgi:hypothetical protein
LTWWPLVHLQLPVSGISIGIGLLLAAEIIESLYLRWQRQRQPDSIRQLAPL